MVEYLLAVLAFKPDDAPSHIGHPGEIPDGLVGPVKQRCIHDYSSWMHSSEEWNANVSFGACFVVLIWHALLLCCSFTSRSLYIPEVAVRPSPPSLAHLDYLSIYACFRILTRLFYVLLVRSHCLSSSPTDYMSQNRFMKCRSMCVNESSTETEIENL